MAAPKSNSPSLHSVISIPVALIVLVAIALSVAAVMENLRFARAADQVLELVSRVRTLAAGQRGFAQTAGEDVWADLSRAGQVMPSATHPNPWGGDIRAQTLSNVAMRIEDDLPSRDCRRLALYFLGRQPLEIGLLAIEAQSPGDNGWAAIYPPPPGMIHKMNDIVSNACGKTPYARIAFVFQMR